MGYRLSALLLTATLLVACGGGEADADASRQGEDSLPKPGAVSGSVTGMPNPGTASAPPVAMRAQDVIEIPEQVEVDPAVADEAGLKPVPASDQTAVTFDQPAPELANEPPADSALPDNPSDATEPVPPQQ